MANFTIRIKDLLAANFDIWDSVDPFPIYREEHRADLKKKIVDYYYMQEIGFETPQTFKHYLNSRLRIVMPYYNAKYAALEKFMEVPENSIHTMNIYRKAAKSTTSPICTMQ